MERLKGSAALLLCSFLWGMGFVAQKLGLEHMPPIIFNAIRNVLGSVVLLPVIFIFSKRDTTPKDEKASLKRTIIAGSICGMCLFVGSNLQQVGLQYTTAGKAGFITSLYIVLVPIIGVLTGRKARWVLVASLILAVSGLYMLCITEGFYLAKGDILVCLCAIAFTFHILSVDHFGRGVDSVKLSSIQFAVCAILSFILSLFIERDAGGIGNIWLAVPAILYLGVCSSGIAFTLQIVGQKRVNPTVASLIMSLESVFSVLGGAVIMNEVLSKRELIGCALMFIAVLLSQIPPKKKQIS